MNSSSRRWWTIAALVPAVLAGGLDVIVLNLALPTLASELGATGTDLQWFVAAYSLAFAAALLPGGMLGDRFGRKRLLLIGLVIFGVASIACAFAPSSAVFIAARAVLGIGAAIIVPMVLGVLPVVFSPQERPKAVAIVTAATAGGIALGPILGGWLLSNYWWGSVFLINVPVVLVALVAVAAWLPESRSTERRRFDAVGVVASSAGLAALTYGFIGAGQHGWTDPIALGPMVVGVVILAAFVLWERRVRDPLVDLGLFRSASFTWGTIFATLVSFLMYAVIFAAPQYFQAILGVDAQGSGLRLLPLVIGLFIGAGVAQRLTPRVGSKAIVTFGFLLVAIALFAGATTSVTTGDAFVLAWIGLSGLGIGFVLPAAMDAALGTLSVEHSGVGSALIQAARMVGTTFGVAALGSVLTSVYRDRLDVTGLPAAAADTVRDGVAAGVAVAQQLGSGPLLESVRRAFVEGMDAMLLVNAAIAAVGVILAFVFMPRRSTALEPGEGGRAPIGEVSA